MNLIPTGRELATFGAVALVTVWAINNVPQIRQIVKPNGG